MKLLLYAILICCLVDQIVECARKKNIHPPIILVPGIGDSRFDMKLDKTTSVDVQNCVLVADWSPFWLNPSLLFQNLQCFVENFKLIFNLQTKTTSNYPGVQIRVDGFGNASSVSYNSAYQAPFTAYFAALVTHLENLGYEDGVSLRGAPYDFRKAPNEQEQFFADLKNLVEDTYEKNGNKKVILLGHSMGCMFTLYFLNHQKQAWKDRFIRSFVSTSGPYGGAIKTLHLLVSGDNFGISGFNATAVKEAQKSLTTSAFLMPYDTFWSRNEVLVQGPNRSYTVNDYEQFFNDINFPVGFVMRKVVEPLIKKLEPPGVKVHCVYSSSVNTSASFHYSDWNSEPTVTEGDGDGSVNIVSLMGCERWRNTNSRKVSVLNVKGATHVGILRDPAYFAYIDKLIG